MHEFTGSVQFFVGTGTLDDQLLTMEWKKEVQMNKCLCALVLILSAAGAREELVRGNVIFLHPDGTGLSSWNIARILFKGPDGTLNWDRIPHVGFYRSHMENSLTASSHSGATVHAYGVKVKQDSFGMNGKEPLTALSGTKMSIMQEAMDAGIRVGIVNTGSVVEPGTAVFVASSESRGNSQEITKKVLASGADVIFSGGEEWMLPKGVKGVHAAFGRRTDGSNLIKKAKQRGYIVIYNKRQLQELPRHASKVLGVFAASHTFNALSEESLREKGLPLYNPSAPSFNEMVKAAVEILSHGGKRFFLVAEEEATDNFANNNNARGTLTAHKRSDEVFGYALDFVDKHPDTLLITASDSEAGGMELFGPPSLNKDSKLPEKDAGGAPYDGVNGTGTKPFVSAPDKNGNRFPFVVMWSSYQDLYGSVITRAAGLHAELLNVNCDNTDVYRLMYAVLFGVYLD